MGVITDFKKLGWVLAARIPISGHLPACWTGWFLWLDPECCFGHAQPRSGHLMDVCGIDLVSWCCWWFPRHVGDGAEPRTASEVMPGQAERAARRPRRRVRGCGFNCFWRGLFCWAGPSLLFQLGCVHPTYMPALLWKRPRAKVNCCVLADHVQWVPSAAHSWSMVPVLEASSSCGGKSPSQGLPSVLAAEA